MALSGRHFLRQYAADPVALAKEIPGLMAAVVNATEPEGVTRALGQLGETMRMVGRLDEAVLVLSEAVTRADEGGWKELAVTNRIRLATALHYRGDAGAELMFREALRFAEEPGAGEQAHVAWQHLGKLLAETGRDIEAKECFHLALDAREKLGDEELLASTRQALALLDVA